MTNLSLSTGDPTSTRRPFRRFALSSKLALVLVGAIVAGSSAAACDSGVDDDWTNETPPIDTPVAEVTVISDVRPPPISGGTLLASRDGTHVIVSDPDRDRIVTVDLSTQSNSVGAVLALEPGDEPGRGVEDATGLVHVLTRASGYVVTVDPNAKEIVGRRRICPAPRGIAYDVVNDLIHVACVGGELLSLEAAPTGQIVRRLDLKTDLRDVIVEGERLLVSRFRSAELITINAEGEIENMTSPLQFNDTFAQQSLAPAVAWRTIRMPGGGALMLHQRSMAGILPEGLTPETPPVYYGPNCWEAAVQGSATVFAANGDVVSAPSGGRLANVVLGVDVAISPNGAQTAYVSASNDTVGEVPTSLLAETDLCSTFSATQYTIPGEPIAVTYAPNGTLIVQSREPSQLTFISGYDGTGTQLDLGGPSRADSGHKLFHGNPDGVATGVACASCHPEGRDDGRVYLFGGDGPRRSMTLTGGILQTAPFHWSGDLETMDSVMSDVFVSRMGGLPQTPARLSAVATYIDNLRDVVVSPPLDPVAVERGKTLFESEAVGCADCHTGARLTNATTVDVGTGGKFQVPSLVGIGLGGPFMHNGCAPTLRDRFTAPCGGGDLHGHTSQLAAEEADDLVAYLASL